MVSELKRVRRKCHDWFCNFIQVFDDDPADWDALLHEVRNVLTINHPDDVEGLQKLANTLNPRNDK